MRTLPPFVGGFIRPHKITFIANMVRLRILEEVERLASLRESAPTGESIAEEYVEFLGAYPSEAHIDSDCESLSRVVETNFDDAMERQMASAAQYVDIALAVHAEEVRQSESHVRNLQQLLRYVTSDAQKAVTLLDAEIVALTQLKQVNAAIGKDVTYVFGDSAINSMKKREKSFFDEISFLSVVRDVLKDAVESVDAVK